MIPDRTKNAGATAGLPSSASSSDTSRTAGQAGSGTPADWANSLHDLARLYGATSAETSLLHAREKRRARRSAGSLDLLEWGRRHLPEHFVRPPSLMHRWLAGRLDAARRNRGTKLNVLAPRGAAKSTLGTLAMPLLAALEGWEPYIWIVSDTKHQARAHLENIKAELLENRLLADAYPAAAGRGPVWRANSIVLANGAAIEAFGAGQRIRGRRRRQHRPTLIVCDDLQNDGHIRSALQREQSRDWFHGTLLNAGTPATNVVNLATALHRDALAMELHRTPGWTSRLFQAIVRWPTNATLWREWEAIYTDLSQTRRTGCQQKRRTGCQPVQNELAIFQNDRTGCQPVQNELAIFQNDRTGCQPVLRDNQAAAREFYERNRRAMDAGAVLLWPEIEDLYTLMRLRAESGRTAFEREKQNSPIDPDRCEWPEEYFDESIWFDDWPGELAVRTMALDPSKGSDSRRGDYSALVWLGVDRRGMIYVDADLARRPTPEIVAAGVERLAAFRPDLFGVEVNQFQELLAGEFENEFGRRGLLGARPVPIDNRVSKQVRIRRLGPFLASRRLRFKDGSPSSRLLVEQLMEFPVADHDDGPDALEMAIRLAQEILHGRAFNDGLGDRLTVG